MHITVGLFSEVFGTKQVAVSRGMSKYIEHLKCDLS